MARVPNREEHNLPPLALFLDAEVALMEAAGHEVTAGDRLLDGQFAIDQVGLGGGVVQMHRTGRAGRWRLFRRPGRQ